MDKSSLRRRVVGVIEKPLSCIASICAEIGLSDSRFDELSEPYLNNIFSQITAFEYEMVKLKDLLENEVKANAVQVSSMCEDLGLNPEDFKPSQTMPTYESLQFLKEKATFLKEKKWKMELEEFRNVRKKFLSLLEDLNPKVLDQFEEFVSNLVPEATLELPTEDLRCRIKQLEEQKESNKEKNVNLLRHLRKLVQTLNVPVDEEPLATITDPNDPILYRIDTLDDLQSRVDHYLELRRSSLKSCFETTRKEVKEIWQACMFSKEYQTSCDVFFSESHESEKDLLELEDYLVECRRISSTVIPLMEKIDHYKESWKELKEVEVRLNDPDKFLNRGGRMLKDETLKKKLLHTLPKMEIDITKEIDLLETSLDLKLVPELLLFSDNCHERWKMYHDKKDMEIHARQKHKTDTMNHELRFGSKPVAVTKKHVAGLALRNADIPKKKVVPLKTHIARHVLYAMERNIPESHHSTKSSHTSDENVSSSTSNENPTKRPRF